MFRTNVIRALACCAALTAIVGCHGDDRGAVQLDMARMDEMREQPRTHLANMVDNAILHDMSLADFHFVPHSTELSGSGVARLDRMALLLDTYGGVVRYEASTTDEELIKGRLDHVKEYLTLVGCSMEKVALTTGLSGGRGMSVANSIETEDALHEAQIGQMKNAQQDKRTSFTSLSGS